MDQNTIPSPLIQSADIARSLSCETRGVYFPCLLRFIKESGYDQRYLSRYLRIYYEVDDIPVTNGGF